MKINRKALVSDVGKAMPGIATGVCVVEDADTLVFKSGHIYSYNSIVSVDVAESSTTGLEGVVNGVDFYNCLNKLVSDEIEVEQGDGEWTIKDGKIKVAMKLLPSENIFERFESLQSDEGWVKINGEEFHKALSVCNMPKNSSRYSGIYVDGKAFLSTDTFVINKYEVASEYPSFFVSNDVAAELLKWSDLSEVQLNKMWIRFKSSTGTVFSARTLSPDGFPKASVYGLLEKNSSAPALCESTFTPDFYDAVERASTFSMDCEGQEVVAVSIGSDGCKIKSERTSGVYEETVADVKASDGNTYDLELAVGMVRGCRSVFDDFKIVANGDKRMLVLKKDLSLKIISVLK